MEQVKFRANVKKLAIHMPLNKGKDSRKLQFNKFIFPTDDAEEIEYLRGYAERKPGVVKELVKGKMVKEFEVKESETELEALERRMKELKDAQKEAVKEDKTDKADSSKKADEAEVVAKDLDKKKK